MSLIRGLNPLESARNEEEALGAARASTIGMVVGGIWGIAAHFLSQPLMEAAAKAGTMPEMPEGAKSIGLMVAIGWFAVQVGLGILQWFKPNVVIPIIFFFLSLLGVVASLVMPMMGPSPIEVPTWMTMTGWAVTVICLLLHLSGWRGASALKRFQSEY